MKLYEIDQAIMACVDPETGEITDLEKLEQLSMDREKKLEGVALYIKDLTAEAKAIKAEEEALALRQKVKESHAQRLKDFLTLNLDGQKMETPRVVLSWRKSTKTIVSDPDATMAYLVEHQLDTCIKVKAPEISTSEVGKLLKKGEAIPGAELVESQNLQIK